MMQPRENGSQQMMTRNKKLEEKTNQGLFWSTHVLRKHLPEVRQLSYNLHPRVHTFFEG